MIESNKHFICFLRTQFDTILAQKIMTRTTVTFTTVMFFYSYLFFYTYLFFIHLLRIRNFLVLKILSFCYFNFFYSLYTNYRCNDHIFLITLMYFQLTWADFVFIGIIEAVNLFLNTEIEKKYPTCQTLIQKIRSLPGVKEYIATRKPYNV